MAKAKAGKSTRARTLRRFFGLLRAGRIKGEKLQKNFSKHQGQKDYGARHAYATQRGDKSAPKGGWIRKDAAKDLRLARSAKKGSNKLYREQATEMIKGFKEERRRYR